MPYKNPQQLAKTLIPKKPRDDAFNQKMNEYHAKRKELLNSKDPNAYLGPKWNALSKEIQDFRGGYEPAQKYSPREWLLDNDIDEFQIDQVRDDIGFDELWDSLQKGEDFYEKASVNGEGFDSEVREKIFSAMAEKLGLEYDDIYNAWLGRGKPIKQNPNPKYIVDNGNPNPKTYQSKFKAKYPDRYEKARGNKLLADLSDEDIDNFARDLGIDLD